MNHKVPSTRVTDTAPVLKSWTVTPEQAERYVLWNLPDVVHFFLQLELDNIESVTVTYRETED